MDESAPTPLNDVVDLAGKLAQFDDHWAPRTVARFNRHDVMVVKVSGEFVVELLLIEPSGTPNTGDSSTAARRIEI